MVRQRLGDEARRVDALGDGVVQLAGQVVAHLVGRLEVLLHPQAGVHHGRGHAAGRRLRELDVPLPEGRTVRRCG